MQFCFPHEVRGCREPVPCSQPPRACGSGTSQPLCAAASSPCPPGAPLVGEGCPRLLPLHLRKATTSVGRGLKSPSCTCGAPRGAQATAGCSPRRAGRCLSCVALLASPSHSSKHPGAQSAARHTRARLLIHLTCFYSLTSSQDGQIRTLSYFFFFLKKTNNLKQAFCGCLHSEDSQQLLTKSSKPSARHSYNSKRLTVKKYSGAMKYTVHSITKNIDKNTCFKAVYSLTED